MLDIKKIRKESDKLCELLSLRGSDYSVKISEIKELDEKWRSYIVESEELKKEKNSVSAEIGILKKDGKEVSEYVRNMKKIAGRIKELDEATKKVKILLNKAMLNIPNLPADGIPQKDKVIKETGQKKKFDFDPRPHWEIGELLKILDFKTAAKLSGARFALLQGDGAMLERALISFMLDIHIEKFNYIEIMPPYLVKEEIMVGTGQLPKFKEEMYAVEGGELYLIPTAEVPLVNIHRDEILAKDNLPIKYVSHTPCFRREAGSYGRDTSGLIRNHQFNKVELVNIVIPEESEEFHLQLLKESEEILKQLKLSYRVVELGVEGMGFSAVRTYDLEVWMPGEKKWREVSSCSNCSDFQARRTEIRYRGESGEINYVHTLNSSGLAVGRLFAAILENFQTEEINVKIPEALIKYMKGRDIIVRGCQ